MSLLQVNDLRVAFQTDHGLLTAVDGVSFSLEAGRTLGIVGESGCGKSVTARALMRLLEHPSGRVLNGEVHFDGRDVLKLPLETMRKVRGKEIAMIFQEPMTALNPVHRVGRQIIENISLHENLSPQAALKRAVELMEWVGIPAPDKRVNEYPHQLSGGMRQRVMIAMALSCSPKLLIADEPTTALDVTVQAQILELINRLQKETGMAVILITHDLGVIAETADEVAVMYAGRIAERGSAERIFASPTHPYTRGLIQCLPKLGSTPKTPLPTIPGSVPSLRDMPQGCRFASRSGIVHEAIHLSTRPPFVELSSGHWVEKCPVCVGTEVVSTDQKVYHSSENQDHEDQTSRQRAAQDSWKAALAELAGSPCPSGSPSGRSARRTERLRQLDLLYNWGIREQRVLDVAALGLKIEEASEHQVFYDAPTGSAIKVTIPGRCGNAFPQGGFDAALPEEYCQRWLRYNELFGDAVALLGVARTDEGVSIVISQRWIEGERPDRDEITAYMAGLGFAQAPNLRDYFNEADLTAVLDCHEDNFIKEVEGKPVPIDVHVMPLDADMRRALCI